jgi:hypothetical protein
MKGVVTVEQLEIQLSEKRYDVLIPMIEQGRSLEHCHYEDDHGAWETLLFLCMFRTDYVIFRHILQRHSVSILEHVCNTLNGDETGWVVIVRLLEEAGTYKCIERYGVLLEIALDTGEIDDTDVIDYELDRTGAIIWKWNHSRDAKIESIRTAVWCCQAVRDAYGVADGLGEPLGKRMQAASTWDYEPKIMRGRF